MGGGDVLTQFVLRHVCFLIHCGLFNNVQLNRVSYRSEEQNMVLTKSSVKFKKLKVSLFANRFFYKLLGHAHLRIRKIRGNNTAYRQWGYILVGRELSDSQSLCNEYSLKPCRSAQARLDGTTPRCLPHQASHFPAWVRRRVDGIQ